MNDNHLKSLSKKYSKRLRSLKIKNKLDSIKKISSLQYDLNNNNLEYKSLDDILELLEYQINNDDNIDRTIIIIFNIIYNNLQVNNLIYVSEICLKFKEIFLYIFYIEEYNDTIAVLTIWEIYLQLIYYESNNKHSVIENIQLFKINSSIKTFFRNSIINNYNNYLLNIEKIIVFMYYSIKNSYEELDFYYSNNIFEYLYYIVTDYFNDLIILKNYWQKVIYYIILIFSILLKEEVTMKDEVQINYIYKIIEVYYLKNEIDPEHIEILNKVTINYLTSIDTKTEKELLNEQFFDNLITTYRINKEYLNFIVVLSSFEWDNINIELLNDQILQLLNDNSNYQIYKDSIMILFNCLCNNNVDYVNDNIIMLIFNPKYINEFTLEETIYFISLLLFKENKSLLNILNDGNNKEIIINLLQHIINHNFESEYLCIAKENMLNHITEIIKDNNEIIQFLI